MSLDIPVKVAEILEAFGRLRRRATPRSAPWRLMGVADRLREIENRPINTDHAPEYLAAVNALRTALGAAAFQREWRTGRRMTLEAGE